MSQQAEAPPSPHTPRPLGACFHPGGEPAAGQDMDVVDQVAKGASNASHLDQGRLSVCSRRSSVYSCGHLKAFPGDPSYRIPAKSVRSQVRAAARRLRSNLGCGYPKCHKGHEHKDGAYKLSAQRPWVEFPILNNTSGHAWQEGVDPGPVRAVYNDNPTRR